MYGPVLLWRAVLLRCCVVDSFYSVLVVWCNLGCYSSYDVLVLRLLSRSMRKMLYEDQRMKIETKQRMVES